MDTTNRMTSLFDSDSPAPTPPSPGPANDAELACRALLEAKRPADMTDAELDLLGTVWPGLEERERYRRRTLAEYSTSPASLTESQIMRALDHMPALHHPKDVLPAELLTAIRQERDRRESLSRRDAALSRLADAAGPDLAAVAATKLWPADHQRAALDVASGWLGRSSGILLITGPAGTGKSQIAARALFTAISRGASDAAPWDCDQFRFVTESQLLDRQRRAAAKHKRYGASGFRDAHFLVLDDIGGNRLNDTEFRLMKQVIESRYSSKRPTIVTTNCDGKALIDVYGQALFSRLTDRANTVLIKLAGPDLRANRELLNGELRHTGT
jgi:DNA replication protein DnaC